LEPGLGPTIENDAGDSVGFDRLNIGRKNDRRFIVRLHFVTAEDALPQALRQLEAFYGEMRGAFALPALAERGTYRAHRYAVHTDSLACYLKGVKLISTLNAALVLFQHGYPQKVGALCRMADDFSNEVMFILLPQQGEEVDAAQRQFLENFF
jgi:hypothetical protein